MQQSYTDFIRSDHSMFTQRMIHIILQRLTAQGVQEGIFRASKNDLSMKRLYKKLFPSSQSSSSLVAAHRLKLHLQDGMEKEALEQMRKISSFTDSSIFCLLNHSFLLALIGKMPMIVEAFLSKGFPPSINSRVLGTHKNIVFPTYFLLALAVQNLSIIMLFFKRNIDYLETWHGLGPVHLAAVNPDIRVLDMVLGHGNALEYTTTMHYSLLCSLSKKETDLQKMIGGRPIYPIDLAAVAGNWGALLLLIKKAPKSAKLSQNLLHILNGLDMSINAIQQGATIDQTLFDGSTVLHTKAYSNRAAMAAFYLGCGLSTEEKNKKGDTPLLVALKQSHQETSWVLVQHGAIVPPTYATHPIILAINEGWAPDTTIQDQINYYYQAGTQALPLPKPPSRFSITGILNPMKKNYKYEMNKLNNKIERISTAIQSTLTELPKEEIYDQFIKMVSKRPPSKTNPNTIYP
ncbi:hypothetical protein NEHOM01_1983 [Nematocida homosporus]|uniref:uncharacterized protein n=1 Tax=Nematocida homosporus TaxID=1912981 RepID=UPI0022203871|nr:uncharacterized protein NEHOM01_1983 [Nematocida homosporus]KAI5187174.1 hypothetical protein NEHOM01_1983 [Nematocida homosporus]